MTTLPAPRTPDPMAAPPLRWGVMAPGKMSRTMANAVKARTRQEIVAVASRSVDRAQTFADEFAVPTAYGSYAELVADPSVDVVYVASPHSEHRDNALLAIEAGKPVLIEKAFARNGSEAREVVAAAQARGVFCMEAMWTRFLPGMDVVRQSIEQGLLGDIEVVFADHGQPLYPGGPARLSDPALAGGALLDLTVYPLTMAALALGDFASVTAIGSVTPEGVDRQEAVIVQGADGGMAVLHATMGARSANVASVVGTKGRLDIGERSRWRGRWYAPEVVRFTGRDAPDTAVWEPGALDHGLEFELAEVARRVSAGETESPLMPLAESVRIMDVMDDVRRQLGVVFPGEAAQG